MEEACVISNGFPHQSQKLHKINSSDKNFSVSNAYMNQQRFIHCTLMQKKVSHTLIRRQEDFLGGRIIVDGEEVQPS